MALANTVTAHHAIGAGGRWSDPHANPAAPFATSCHFATLFWAFRDEFGREPTQDEVIRIGVAQTVVSGLIAHGTRKNQPMVGNLALTAGAILAFVDGGIACHSCVAITNHSVGGYNQMSWYSAGGGDHRYSTHDTGQLIWGSLGTRSKVSRVNRQGGHWYELYEIPEMWVKATVRSLVQP